MIVYFLVVVFGNDHSCSPLPRSEEHDDGWLTKHYFTCFPLSRLILPATPTFRHKPKRRPVMVKSCLSPLPLLLSFYINMHVVAAAT